MPRGQRPDSPANCIMAEANGHLLPLTLLGALVYPLSGWQVLPERLRDPHHGLTFGNVQLREQRRLGHRITLHKKVIAFLVQAGRAAVAGIAAKKLQRQSRPLTCC